MNIADLDYAPKSTLESVITPYVNKIVRFRNCNVDGIDPSSDKIFGSLVKMKDLGRPTQLIIKSI